MKSVALFWLVVFAVLLLEFGCVLVLFFERPNAPLGARAWFTGLMVAAPIYVFWMYLRTIGRKS